MLDSDFGYLHMDFKNISHAKKFFTLIMDFFKLKLKKTPLLFLAVTKPFL